MFNDPFSFKGRISRTEYAISYLFYIVCFIWASAFSFTNVHEGFLPNQIFYMIPFWIFLLAQGAKRCHDLGNSGWFMFIPFYSIWMFLAEGDKGDNYYGEDPKAFSELDFYLDESEEDEEDW